MDVSARGRDRDGISFADSRRRMPRHASKGTGQAVEHTALVHEGLSVEERDGAASLLRRCMLHLNGEIPSATASCA